MHSLQQLIADELAVPVQPCVAGFATHIAAQYPGAARAVLFYGSCLRSEELEALKQERQALSDAIENTRLRLDSVRVIITVDPNA